MYQGYKQIVVKKEGKILIVKFDNPKKKNAINRIGYVEITRAFREVADDDTVTVVVLTGAGEFFTSGNDLSMVDITDFDAYTKQSTQIFKDMVLAVIDCPKIIFSLVNGPSIGIGATLVGISDISWCSDTAYFLTPFTKLGIVPEAGSSYLFPLIIGRSKASEMLLFSEKLSADEAYKYNFVSKIFKNSDLNTVIWPKIRAFSELPPQSMQITKKLLRMHEKDALRKALDIECEELQKRYYSEEFANAMMEFSTRKTKSKM